MSHPAFSGFLQQMDELVAMTDDPNKIAERTGGHLATLLRSSAFIEDRFRAPGTDHYRQHVVHVHPASKYSVVSLVWTPGQATPIHDHRCWCVVGVLQGLERETRFSLHRDGDAEWLVETGANRYEPGEVCELVPPRENIHRVENYGDTLAISIHVYGANIAEVGTSINRTFDGPVRASAPSDSATCVSWREAGPANPARARSRPPAP